METFEKYESEVRGYCRDFPTIFNTAKDAKLINEDGKEYLDFLSGAGTLNYGHNNKQIKNKVIDYLQSDGILHGLDMATQAKEEFLKTFQNVILKPRNLNYKMQFTGPTGTNSVEAALKLARKITGRTSIISFTNGFHGMTLGSVAITGNEYYRKGAGIPLNNVNFMPYDGYLGENISTIEYLKKMLKDKSSGVDLPAAIIVETVQGEGGVNVASFKWLRDLRKLCTQYNILMIIDDIQVGCGRTGTFFSFEPANIEPDIITLSKSLSGFGLPMSLVLMKPELDQWKPGEHNGTFRGNNLAFVSSTAALKTYWADKNFSKEILEKAQIVKSELEDICESFPEGKFTHRGRGLIQGLVSEVPGLSDKIKEKAFEKGLIIETSGAESQVLKFLPPLTIKKSQLQDGLQIVSECIESLVNSEEDKNDNKKAG